MPADPLRLRMYLFPLFLALSVLLLPGCSLMETKDPKPASFDPQPGEVVLQWKGDPNLRGFNLYRSSENGSPVRVNSDPIKPLKLYTGGKGLVDYQYTDRGVAAGEIYYYRYEEVGANGKTTQWETPIQKTAVPVLKSQP